MVNLKLLPALAGCMAMARTHRIRPQDMARIRPGLLARKRPGLLAQKMGHDAIRKWAMADDAIQVNISVDKAEVPRGDSVTFTCTWNLDDEYGKSKVI